MTDHTANEYQKAKFPEPREFQKTAHDALRKGFVDGHKNQLIMAPTGGGKGFLGLRIAHEALLKGKRAVFVCDRTTLINQISQVADSYGLSSHGVIQANHWRRNDLPFQIASIQTIAKRGYWPKADVIIIDECHSRNTAWTEYIMQTPAAVIGLSATPFSDGLGNLFSNLINAATMHELTQQGVLVPMRIFTCTRPDMTGAKTVGGEWSDKAAEERGMQIIGDVVSEWIKYANDKKTIVFGATINHCKELCKQFINAGIMAAVFTSQTTATERELLLNEYRKHDSNLKVLISVEALAKGFDVPDVECVVDCRPLRKSLSTAIQMWGRGLRSSPETGKSECILLDHSGNILRFAEDYTDIFFNGLDKLDTGEKLDKKIRKDDEEIEKKGCPSCGYKPFFKRCMSCGYEIQEKSLIEHQVGQMQEITLNGKKLANNQTHLWHQVATYAKYHSKPEKQQARAAHLFKAMTGVFPPWGWKVTDAPDVEVTRNVYNKITNLNLKYKKGIGNAVR